MKIFKDRLREKVEKETLVKKLDELTQLQMDKVKQLRAEREEKNINKIIEAQLKKMVAVDKKKICPVITENEGYYICSGEIMPFRVSKERCKVIDDEFFIIMNLYGPTKVNEYAKEKGYIE